MMGGHIPLEYIMAGGIGFLAAWLTALLVMPAVHHRAVRLTRRHYDELPLSIQEMRADKDSIRAGFAAATSKLETSIAQLKDKTAAHATDLAKKVQLIARLKQELVTADAALTESEAREQTTRVALRDAKRDLAGKDAALGAAEQEIAAIKREIAAIAPQLARPERRQDILQETRRETQQETRVADIVPLAPLRAPLDVVPPPTHLLPPVSAKQSPRHHDDRVTRAWTEIKDAARRVDDRYDSAPDFGRRPNGGASSPNR